MITAHWENKTSKGEICVRTVIWLHTVNSIRPVLFMDRICLSIFLRHDLDDIISLTVLSSVLTDDGNIVQISEPSPQ